MPNRVRTAMVAAAIKCRIAPATIIASAALFFSLGGVAQARGFAAGGALLHTRGLEAAATLTLVTPNGQPIGGQWQRWVDEAEVPTISGDLAIISTAWPVDPNEPWYDSPAMCPADACSVSPNAMTLEPDGTLQNSAPWPRAQTWLSPDTTRFGFYFEMGHQFDFAILTDATRAELLAYWGDGGDEWWDGAAGPTGTNVGEENGAEATFAGAYANCALGWYPIEDPANGSGGPFIKTYAGQHLGTCRLIEKIGRQAGADMPWKPAS